MNIPIYFRKEISRDLQLEESRRGTVVEALQQNLGLLALAFALGFAALMAGLILKGWKFTLLACIAIPAWWVTPFFLGWVLGTAWYFTFALGMGTSAMIWPPLLKRRGHNTPQ